MSYEDMRRHAAKGRESRLETISGVKRASGGSVKKGGKGTTVNVIIAGQGPSPSVPPAAAMARPMMPPPRPPMPMPPPGGMPPPSGMPPGGPPPMPPQAGIGAPMMGHKRGGRIAKADGGLIGVGVGGRSAIGRIRKAAMAERK